MQTPGPSVRQHTGQSKVIKVSEVRKANQVNKVSKPACGAMANRPWRRPPVASMHATGAHNPSCSNCSDNPEPTP